MDEIVQTDPSKGVFYLLKYFHHLQRLARTVLAKKLSLKHFYYKLTSPRKVEF